MLTKEQLIVPENRIYGKPTLMNETPMHYCPGCSHGVVHKLVAEIIEEMGMEEDTIAICPVGCAVFAYRYVDVDWIEASHGRAPACASAIKRLWPNKLVFTYQGDGDMACIGTGETIHALNRGENIAMIFINNAIYGMTGGQMAPTTLMGMKTARRHLLRDTSGGQQCGEHPQGKEGHSSGIRELSEQEGHFPRRDCIYLCIRMEDDTRTSQPMDGGQHVPILSTGRLKEHCSKGIRL